MNAIKTRQSLHNDVADAAGILRIARRSAAAMTTTDARLTKRNPMAAIFNPFRRPPRHPLHSPPGSRTPLTGLGRGGSPPPLSQSEQS